MFQEKICFNVEPDHKNKINSILKNKPFIYKDRSHFVRCAVIKQIREEEEAKNEK